MTAAASPWSQSRRPRGLILRIGRPRFAPRRRVLEEDTPQEIQRPSNPEPRRKSAATWAKRVRQEEGGRGRGSATISAENQLGIAKL